MMIWSKIAEFLVKTYKLNQAINYITGRKSFLMMRCGTSSSSIISPTVR